MKRFILGLMVASSAALTTAAFADSGSLCEQNPDAPMCRPFPPQSSNDVIRVPSRHGRVVIVKRARHSRATR